MSCAAAFLLEQFDDLIYSPREAEAASGSGAYWRHSEDSTRRSRTLEAELSDPRSAVSEAFRSTCTSLQFSTETGVPKALIDHQRDAGGRENKHRARHRATIRRLGLKVLIVDADIRKPSLHSKIGIDNSMGLSTYLTHNCTDQDAIRQNEPAKLNLYGMTSGPLPPNPVELLHGPHFASLTVRGRRNLRFDYH